MFKFIIVACALFATASAIDHHSYGGHHEVSSHGSSEEAHAEIKSLHSDVNPHGFEYGYETTNHIRAAAHGDEHGNIQGDFEWLAPHGEHIAVKYVADENGYQPSSDVLPTPHPIPVAILKSIEYIRNHPSHEENQHHYGRH
ncbi:larval cuticle protein 4-like [Cochliomyia hominivorax]